MEEVQNSGDLSEEENDLNLLNNTKSRKVHKIIDSDSDSEEKQTRNDQLETKLTSGISNEEENDLNLLNKTKSRNVYKIIDSDSDSEEKQIQNDQLETKLASGSEDEQQILESVKNTNKKKLKRVVMANNESESSDDEVTPHNKSFPDEETAVEAIIYTTNSKGELIPENDQSEIQKPSLSLLCDAESSDEEGDQNIVENSEDEVIRPQVYKPKRRKKDNKPKMMSAQEASKQRFEIQAESQRMLRESNISLPYHKPKTFTIKEFLQKRSKLASALPVIPQAPPSVAIKMSKDQLVEVSKKLDERIKEVEEFYKSESEDEEENVEKVTSEIRCWLDILVDNAVDSAENKRETEENKDVNETENPESSNEPESMDYEFNLDGIDETSKKPTISELLQDRLLNIQPKLSGEPDDVIDLDKGITKPSEIKKLVEKYFQHTAKKISHKHKVELNVVNISRGGEIINETVSMNVDDEDEPVMIETPGAKLQKLREELQNQMAQKRSELWKQKQEHGDCLRVEKKIDEDKDAPTEKDVLDDEEEEEMTESEYDEEEEEDFDLQPEKLQKKSAFIEDEADEDEEICEDDEDPIQDEPDLEDNNEIEDNNDGFDGDDEEISNDIAKKPKKKALKRILKPFSEDSDEEEEIEGVTQEITNVTVAKKLNNSTASSEDDFLPPNLPRATQTPQKTQIEKSKSDFDFLTPVTYLTGLQNLNSDSKQLLKDSPIVSPFHLSSQSPFKEGEVKSGLQKKLFDENSQSQSNIEDLAEICSGEFPQTQEETSVAPSTQDLLDVCSGNFESSNDRNKEKNVINLQSKSNEIKSLDQDHDQIISQLLDEEEFERYKKQFESPVVERSRPNLEQAEEVNATGLINSDDENEELEIKTKKKQKKLVFSDDEEENSDEDDGDNEDKEEEIDLHDSDDEEQILEREIEAEENPNYKATDFFDKEAELSESEWDSADEDEKGLDELEFEKGDEEVFDENKIRTDIERIHMRQILDEDNREVKLLQELLLEDGELHGTGRQRQFRWKALDSMGMGDFEKRDDDDIYLDEDEENEEQWRKMRHKREMFLKKKTSADDVDSILSDSQILKIGQKILKKSQTSTSQSNTPVVNKPEENVKEPFNLLGKRGSFLRRSDQVLQRLAEYTKVGTNQGSGVKNSRAFVFQTIETAETTIIKENNNKRKASEATPNAIKKLRLSDLSPAVGEKARYKPAGAKRLFTIN